MLTKPVAHGLVSAQRKLFCVTHSKAMGVLGACLPPWKPLEVTPLWVGSLPKAPVSELHSPGIVPGLRPTHKRLLRQRVLCCLDDTPSVPGGFPATSQVHCLRAVRAWARASGSSCVLSSWWEPSLLCSLISSEPWEYIVSPLLLFIRAELNPETCL